MTQNLDYQVQKEHFKFYGLPIIHKYFVIFPPSYPICSGYECCNTKRLVELLFSLVKRSGSTILGDFAFVTNLKKILFLNTEGMIMNFFFFLLFLVTMGVPSLYTQIHIMLDWKLAFKKWSQKIVPSKCYKVTRCNLEKIVFLPTRGWVMGTPMTVNIENVFMTSY